MKLDRQTNDWIESHRNLIDWLIIAERKIVHGQVAINFHQGKITSYDISQRERSEAKEH